MQNNQDKRKNETTRAGTVGSTGISLTLVAKSRGNGCSIYMPDDQAKEKSYILESCGFSLFLS